LFFSVYKKLYIKYVYKLFDGMIVISNKLKNYFRDKVNKNCKIVLIPVITDTEIFKTPLEPKQDGTINIVYAGSMCERKDGVLTLIKSFSQLIHSKSKCRLYLVGSSSNKNNINQIKTLISNLKIENDVILTGYLKNKDYIDALGNADILVLGKPLSTESNYCFPTKLADYLSTGKPVITTNTGEIKDFIIDGFNGYLVKPGDPDEFAEKLLFIINNYDYAIKVGRRGKELAKTKFDYRANTSHFKEYLSGFQTKHTSKKQIPYNEISLSKNV
jgi:glycosyltransferase involved in cell wall biosynthesis